ncbi:MAG: C4-dicarboxylate ABC transporter permease, partial [Pseudomonadales bacterium]|nr:C4-dicarboxylate ABC transporter permease [Pseudomonadales bacterium]
MTETLVQYAWNSFVKGESSMAPDGLPYRFILKSIIPFSILLLMLSLVSRLIKDIALVLGKPKK